MDLYQAEGTDRTEPGPETITDDDLQGVVDAAAEGIIPYSRFVRLSEELLRWRRGELTSKE